MKHFVTCMRLTYKRRVNGSNHKSTGQWVSTVGDFEALIRVAEPDPTLPRYGTDFMTLGCVFTQSLRQMVLWLSGA